MPEWLIEAGIGETRAALVEGGRIVESRIELDGTIPADTILPARLVDAGSNGHNGIVRVEEGTDYLLPYIPRGVTEGASLNIEVTRPALPGPEPWKRAIAKATRDERRRPRSLAERLRSTGHGVRKLSFPPSPDELGEAGWDELVDEARTGTILFSGGSLTLFTTPAMTLIDVDGQLPPGKLAIAAAHAAAGAIRRLDIGGSIGVDFPTVKGKEARNAIAGEIDARLPPPFERTAVNGFGFIQIVRPRRRASLLELAHDRGSFEARHLLRRAALEPAGAKRLVAHPAVTGAIEARPGWIDALARQVGGDVTLQADPSLPIHGGYVEKS